MSDLMVPFVKRALLNLSWACGVALVFHSAVALAADPPMPAGNDPGGRAIALIATGIDYTDPELAKRLARDGEGALIGWDFVDEDHLPFAPKAKAKREDDSVLPADSTIDGSQLAKLAMKIYARGRLVTARVADNNPDAIVKAIGFVARTPARIVIVPFWSTNELDWLAFRNAVSHHKNMVFIVPAGSLAARMSGEPVYPAAFRLDNVIVAAPARGATPAQMEGLPGSTPVDTWVVPRASSMFAGLGGPRPPNNALEAAAMIGGLTACALDKTREPVDGVTMKTALLALARGVKGEPGLRVFDPVCWYGGVRF